MSLQSYEMLPPTVATHEAHMLDQETITQQLALLTTHRRTLAHLLQQQAQFGGAVFAPPQTANSIAGDLL